MQPGTSDLFLLVIIFIGLQLFWLIPIIKNDSNNKLNERGKDLGEEIKLLERLYKK